MQYTLVTLLAASAVTVSAQSYPAFNPEDIDMGTRDQWCLQQTSSCDLLCQNQDSGNEYTNYCEAETLDYRCVCEDGKVPNATEYSQTIPYFKCMSEVNGCVDLCPMSDSACVSNCRDNKLCGASNPTRVNETEKDDGTDSKKDSKSSKGSNDDDEDEESNSGESINLKDSAAALAHGQMYGFAALCATLFVSTYAALL